MWVWVMITVCDSMSDVMSSLDMSVVVMFCLYVNVLSVII